MHTGPTRTRTTQITGLLRSLSSRLPRNFQAPRLPGGGRGSNWLVILVLTGITLLSLAYGVAQHGANSATSTAYLNAQATANTAYLNIQSTVYAQATVTHQQASQLLQLTNGRLEVQVHTTDKHEINVTLQAEDDGTLLMSQYENVSNKAATVEKISLSSKLSDLRIKFGELHGQLAMFFLNGGNPAPSATPGPLAGKYQIPSDQQMQSNLEAVYLVGDDNFFHLDATDQAVILTQK